MSIQSFRTVSAQDYRFTNGFYSCKIIRYCANQLLWHFTLSQVSQSSGSAVQGGALQLPLSSDNQARTFRNWLFGLCIGRSLILAALGRGIFKQGTVLLHNPVAVFTAFRLTLTGMPQLNSSYGRVPAAAFEVGSWQNETP